MKIFHSINAGIFFPAFFILFSNAAFEQNNAPIRFSVIDAYECGFVNNGFVEKDVPYTIQIRHEINSAIKKIKLKSEGITLLNQDLKNGQITIVSKQTGEVSFIAKIFFENGIKQKITQKYNSIELPVLRPEIVVTSPDSKFMWLNLIDVNTGQIANSSFDLCKIDFVLKSENGEIKESGICQKDDDYFPSITLKELPSRFAVNDILSLKIIVVHYEFKLPVLMEADLTIRKIWN